VHAVTADADADGATVEAAHDGYRRLPGRPTHHRRWSVRADELRIDDIVTGRGRHRVTVRWHLAPGTDLRLVPGGAVVTTAACEIEVTVSATSEPTMTAETAQVSAGFGRTVTAPVLACALHHQLPVQISTVWRRAEPRQEPT
jgi:hypothetical protein